MEARKILDEYIESVGKRKTPERYVILDVVLKADGHYCADDICAMLPEDYPISRGTVYSSLNLFVDAGLAYSHQINGKTFYESAFNKAPHHHYICSMCGKMWEFKDKKIYETIAACKTPRFRKSHSALYIYGTCSSCYARAYRHKKKYEEEQSVKMDEEERRFARIGEEFSEAVKWIKRKK